MPSELPGKPVENALLYELSFQVKTEELSKWRVSRTIFLIYESIVKKKKNKELGMIDIQNLPSVLY